MNGMDELVQYRNPVLVCPIGRVTEGQYYRERDRTGSSHGYFRVAAMASASRLEEVRSART